jgi:hypothetical protein
MPRFRAAPFAPPGPAALRRMLAGLVLAAAALVHAPALAQGGATVELRVIDKETGAPLAGAAVRLNGVRRAVSDTTGYALLAGLEPGRHELEVVMVGRRTDSLVVQLAARDVLPLEVMLEMKPVVLPELGVVAPPRPPPGAREPRRWGGGRYYDRALIERMRIRRLSQLLVRIGAMQSNRRGQQASCVPRLVADGIVLGETSVDIIPVQDVEAVEVFSNGDMPPEFGGTTAGVCGLVAVWTRHK